MPKTDGQIQNKKSTHNHLERVRRKEMSLRLQRLRESVPAVAEDAKASQKKVLDEATLHINNEKIIFLSFLREKKKFIELQAKLKRLQGQETPEGKLILFIHYFSSTL